MYEFKYLIIILNNGFFLVIPFYNVFFFLFIAKNPDINQIPCFLFYNPYRTACKTIIFTSLKRDWSNKAQINRYSSASPLVDYVAQLFSTVTVFAEIFKECARLGWPLEFCITN